MGERERGGQDPGGGLLSGAPTPPGSLCSPPMSPKGDSGQAPVTKSIAPHLTWGPAPKHSRCSSAGRNVLSFVPPHPYSEDGFWGRVQKDEPPEMNK